jgi:hypothetical protein
VPEYRAFIVGPNGHFTGHEDMICRDDGEAVINARRLMNGQDQDIEVWSGARLVMRLKQKAK